MACIFRASFTQTKRCLSVSGHSLMPYKPEERLPMTDFQKRIYPQVQQEFTEEGYPVLKFFPRGRDVFTTRARRPARQPRQVSTIREHRMKENQDWPSVWATAKTFSPSAVPLPVRQSFEDKGGPPRGKYCNTELLKIANFLHLSPQAIERHCHQLRKFCTQWPKGLETDEDIRCHFPLVYITKDYLHATPSIRDPRARTVSLQVNIKDLKLNALDEDKLIRLAAHRYDKETGLVTIIADACPVRVQNQDYSDYLLTALYFESIKHEKWESERSEVDLEPPEENIDTLERYRENVEKSLGLHIK